MTRVLAFDLSSTRTGVCVDGKVSSFTPPKGSLLGRARATRAHVLEHIPLTPEPLLVVLEAIGTRMVNTAIALATVHALVLDGLEGGMWNPPADRVLMVTPADLKKFATGKGNADKDTVMLAAAKHEPSITNNDEADAWWLWAIGAAFVFEGWPAISTAYRAAVIKKLKETL